MIRKILKNIGLILFNLIGIYIGTLLGLSFIQDIGGTQDNHFLGGLVSLMQMIIGMVLGIGLGLGSTLLLTVIFIRRTNRNKI